MIITPIWLIIGFIVFTFLEYKHNIFFDYIRSSYHNKNDIIIGLSFISILILWPIIILILIFHRLIILITKLTEIIIDLFDRRFDFYK